MNDSPMKQLDAQAITKAAEGLVREAESAGLQAKIMGSVAVRIVCAGAVKNFDRLRQPPKDIDLVVRFDQTVRFRDHLVRHGWIEVGTELAETEGRKFSAKHPTTGFIVDVYGSKLEFNQELDATPTLLFRSPTLPVVDLLLLKLQIDDKTTEDWFDLAALLATHAIGEDSQKRRQPISRARLTAVLRSWRWRHKVREVADQYAPQAGTVAGLNEEQRTHVAARLKELRKLANAGETFFSRLAAPLRRTFLRPSLQTESVSMEPNRQSPSAGTTKSDQNVVGPKAASRSTGTQGDRVYDRGLEVIHTHITTAIHTQSRLFGRRHWIVVVPPILVVIGIGASIFLCSAGRWPKGEIVVLFEAVGLGLLFLLAVLYFIDIAWHAKRESIADPLSESTAQPGNRAKKPTLIILIIMLQIFAAVVSLLAAIYRFYRYGVYVYGESVDNQVSEHAVGDGSPASIAYVYYVGLLVVTFFCFSLLDRYISKHSTDAHKTTDYSLLFWFVDLPATISFAVLFMVPLLLSCNWPAVGLPLSVHTNIIGGAAWLQMLTSCLVFSLVSGRWPQSFFISSFASVAHGKFHCKPGVEK